MASPYDSQYSGIVQKIASYAARYGIPENIAIAQIWQESRFNPRAGSSAGAQGIAQFIPATAARFGVNVWDIDSSLDGWGRYMRSLLNMFNGRVDIALAGYNSGENRAEYRAAAREGREINWSIMPAGVRSETQNYVRSIMAAAGGTSAASVSLAGVGSSWGMALMFGAIGLVVILILDE